MTNFLLVVSITTIIYHFVEEAMEIIDIELTDLSNLQEGI